jgi:hypothetical protein
MVKILNKATRPGICPRNFQRQAYSLQANAYPSVEIKHIAAKKNVVVLELASKLDGST